MSDKPVDYSGMNYIAGDEKLYREYDEIINDTTTDMVRVCEKLYEFSEKNKDKLIRDKKMFTTVTHKTDFYRRLRANGYTDEEFDTAQLTLILYIISSLK